MVGSQGKWIMKLSCRAASPGHYLLMARQIVTYSLVRDNLKKITLWHFILLAGVFIDWCKIKSVRCSFYCLVIFNAFFVKLPGSLLRIV